jgi:hypothetical protein
MRSICGDLKSEIKRKKRKGGIIFYHMEKIDEKIYTPTKPLESSFTLEANEDMEFKLSKLTMVVESMKDEFKQELNALKYDVHSIKEEILNEIRVHHTFNSSTKKKIKRPRILGPNYIYGKIKHNWRIRGLSP